MLLLLIPANEYGFAPRDAHGLACTWASGQPKRVGQMSTRGSLQRVIGEGARASRRALASALSTVTV